VDSFKESHSKLAHPPGAEGADRRRFGKIDTNIVPSQSRDTQVIPRALAEEFNVKREQRLEEARYTACEKMVRLHFEKVNEIGIGEIAPQLILTLDETGFGASKSDRTKSRNVRVPREFGATPVFKERVDSRFVTAFCAISAA
jgi:hypothetical protein